MPSEKTLRSSIRKQGYNRIAKVSARTAVTAAKKVIVAQDENADVLVSKAISVLDRAAKKGAIHKNNASRRKSRLVQQLNTTRTE
jgi:small subunit ribosomal protein S20